MGVEADRDGVENIRRSDEFESEPLVDSRTPGAEMGPDFHATF